MVTDAGGVTVGVVELVIAADFFDEDTGIGGRDLEGGASTGVGGRYVGGDVITGASGSDFGDSGITRAGGGYVGGGVSGTVVVVAALVATVVSAFGSTNAGLEGGLFIIGSAGTSDGMGTVTGAVRCAFKATNGSVCELGLFVALPVIC